MIRKAALRSKVRLAFGAVIVTLLLAGAMSYRAIAVSGESDHWVRHTHVVLQDLQNLLVAMDHIQTSSHAFALTGAESSLATYGASKSRVGQEEAALAYLTADNPTQQRVLPALKRIAAENIRWADTGIALRRANGSAPVTEIAEMTVDQLAADEFQRVVRELREEELRLLALRDADVNRRLVQTKVILILGTLLGIAMATAAGWAVRHYDFAERNFAENALREGEARFRALANNISQLAWMADERGDDFLV
jgi:CHASE3 domain sensor protein